MDIFVCNKCGEPSTVIKEEEGGVTMWCEQCLSEAIEQTPCAPLDKIVIRHGVDCGKVTHVGGGYLHSEDDDTSYDVDGVSYCGRCHYALD